MKAKIIGLLVAISSVFVFAYCSSAPATMSLKDFKGNDTIACDSPNAPYYERCEIGGQ